MFTQLNNTPNQPNPIQSQPSLAVKCCKGVGGGGQVGFRQGRRGTTGGGRCGPGPAGVEAGVTPPKEESRPGRGEIHSDSWRESGYGIGEYLSHGFRGGIGRFPAGAREVCQGSVGRGGRSVGRSVGRWGRPAGRSVGRSVGSAGVGWGQGSWPGQGGGRVSPHLGRRAGLASLTACEGAGPVPLHHLQRGSDLWEARFIHVMLRSYPHESSPSHQNWELKRE